MSDIFIFCLLYPIVCIVTISLIIYINKLKQPKCEKCGSRELESWWEERVIKISKCKNCGNIHEKEIGKKAYRCEKCGSRKIKIWSDKLIRYKQCIKCGYTHKNEISRLLTKPKIFSWALFFFANNFMILP